MGPSWAHAFVVASGLTLALTPLLRRVAIATDFVDHPVAAAHKSHKYSTPYLGGVGLIMAVLTGLLFAGRQTSLVVVVAIGGGMIGCLGLLDDHRSVGPGARFGLEVVIASVVLAMGLRIHATDIVVIDGLLTIVWIVGVTNAVNLLDNMDGLAAGVATAAATAIFILAILGEQFVVATLAAGLVGACIGFLAHNKPPASIFMGDTGSLFLGFVLAVTSLAVSPALTPPASFAVPLMLLALPVLDTATVTVARLRRGRSVALGGKDHLSHRLVARGLSRGHAVCVLVGIEGLVGLLAVFAGRGRWTLTSTGIAALSVLAGLTLVTAGAPVYEESVVGFPKRLRRAALCAAVLLLLLAGPAMIALARAFPSGTAGADATRDGLEALAAGDTVRASERFSAADEDLRRAHELLGGRLPSLGLLLPGLRVNLATGRALVDAGRIVSAAGSELSAVIEASQVTLSPTSDPIGAMSRLAPALTASVTAIDGSAATIAGFDRPYLLPSLRARVSDLRSDLAEASARASMAADGARLLPAMLGNSGPRRYFLAVQDSSEMRGAGGVVHTWGEVVAENGRLRLTRFGDIEELNGANQARYLGGPKEFLDQYRQFDVPNTWQNVTVSPDFTVTGTAISTLYPQSGGEELDGVIAVDLRGLAALADLTGPVTVDGWPSPVGGAALVDLVLGDAQQRFPVEEDYRAFVRRVSRSTVDALSTAELGTLARVADVLGDAVRGGHLVLFAKQDAEQRLFERMGVAGKVPEVAGDSLLVVNQNLTARHTDSSLQRHIRYDVRLDPGHHPARLSGDVDVSLRNAPPNMAAGENRTYLSVYSPFALSRPAESVRSGVELGRLVHSSIVGVPPDQARTVSLDLDGEIELGPDNWYHLDLLHQASLSPDAVHVEFVVPRGWRIVEVRGLTKVDDNHAAADLLVTGRQQLSFRLERTVWSRLWARLPG